MRSRMGILGLATAILLATSTLAMATPAAQAEAEANAASIAGAESLSRSRVDNTVVNAARTGDSVSAAEAGSTNVIDASTEYQRQVPALIMGTVIPVDCGFGGQAGGANTNAAGFLGASWTTDRCYTLKVANAWAAMGEYEYACEMLMDVSRRAMKRRNISDVDCAIVATRLRTAHTVVQAPQPVYSSTPPNQSNYVTKDQLQEVVDRAFKRSVAK